MYARPCGPYILHFYICHQSGSLLAKSERERRRKITVLTSRIFFLALSDQEEFAWVKLWRIFSQTGEESSRLQITDVFMPWGFFYFYTRVWVTNGSFIQTKKEKYYSEVTLVLLHYSEHIEDTLTSCGLWPTDLLHPSQTDWTGSNCYAQPNWHCRFLEPFWVFVIREVLMREVCLTRVGLAVIDPTCKFSVSFSCFVAFEHKTNHTYASASGLTGLEHTTYWLHHLTFTVSCFLATDAKW